MFTNNTNVDVDLSEDRKVASVEVGGRCQFLAWEQVGELLAKLAHVHSLMRRPWFAGVPGTVLPPIAKAIAAFLMLAVIPCGCSKRVYGPERTERAEVYDTCFVPAGHGSGSGISTSGHFVTADVDIPAHYAIVFKCEHGKFVIEGSRAEEMYKRLSKGDVVTIHYCDKMEVDGGITNYVDLHFLYAEKVQE